MAVAFDAFTNMGTGTGTISQTHTPVGTPKGVLVFVVQDNDTSATAVGDEVTGITYGGTAMGRTRMNTLNTANEDAAVYAYFLGSSVPTGAQTVAVSVNATATIKAAYCITVTAGADTEVVATDFSINGNNITNPSGLLSLSGRTCFVAGGLFSGTAAAANITELANWTARQETDFGGNMGACYTYDTIGSTDVTTGWTQASDAASGIFVAVSEVSGGGGGSSDIEVTVTKGVIVFDFGAITTSGAEDTPAPSSNTERGYGFDVARRLRQWRPFKPRGGRFN